MLVGWKLKLGHLVDMLKLGHLVDMLELGQLGNIFDGFQISTSESTSWPTSYLVLLFYISLRSDIQITMKWIV